MITAPGVCTEPGRGGDLKPQEKHTPSSGAYFPRKLGKEGHALFFIFFNG